MMLVARLALRDLWFQKIQLICNVAVLVGVVVPLLVLFGVKNGVTNALIGDLLNNPRTLQIDTSGNADFSVADAAEVRGWPGAGFVTLKTRSLFDFVSIRKTGTQQRRDAVLIPSGAGDPNLPAGVVLGPDGVVISAGLAAQLAASAGDRVDIVTQAEDRPRQMLLTRIVRAVLPEKAMGGRAILAEIDTLDLVEAFYDAYALPDHGITTGKPLATRVPRFEGMRIYANGLEQLAPLQSRIETRFGIATEARTAEVAGVLGLRRNLTLALLLTTAVAAIGLAAALIFGFWGDVMRKRHSIATLALMGLGGNRLWLFPLVQAAVIGAVALVVSFAMVFVAGLGVEAMFRDRISTDAPLLQISLAEALLISLFVMITVMMAAVFAARAVLRIAPATVLREISA